MHIKYHVFTDLQVNFGPYKTLLKVHLSKIKMQGVIPIVHHIFICDLYSRNSSIRPYSKFSIILLPKEIVIEGHREETDSKPVI